MKWLKLVLVFCCLTVPSKSIYWLLDHAWAVNSLWLLQIINYQGKLRNTWKLKVDASLYGSWWSVDNPCWFCFHQSTGKIPTTLTKAFQHVGNLLNLTPVANTLENPANLGCNSTTEPSLPISVRFIISFSREPCQFAIEKHVCAT